PQRHIGGITRRNAGVAGEPGTPGYGGLRHGLWPSADAVHEMGGRRWRGGYMRWPGHVGGAGGGGLSGLAGVAAGHSSGAQQPTERVMIQMRNWILGAGLSCAGVCGADTFGFAWDNDLFVGLDKNYTNGLRISWVG